MKILKIDHRENFLDVMPENLDDLWHLQRVIEAGDVVSGKTTRKVKPKDESLPAYRQDIFIELKIEKAEFHRYTGKLRLSGVIVSGKPENEVELGAHHSLDVELNERLKIKKETLKSYHIDRLERAKKASHRETVLLVVFDDEAADFAILKDFGYEHKTRIHAGKSGKMFAAEGGTQKYYSEIVKKAQEISAQKIVFGGPGFAKDNLKKYVADKGVELKAYFTGLNSTGETGLNELLKSDILLKISAESEAAKDAALVEQLLLQLGKETGLAVYGIEEVKKAVEFGAVEKLMVAESMLLEKKEKVEPIMEKAEQLKSEIRIISDEGEAGKKLQGFGGIAAILRYRIG